MSLSDAAPDWHVVGDKVRVMLASRDLAGKVAVGRYIVNAVFASSYRASDHSAAMIRKIAQHAKVSVETVAQLLVATRLANSWPDLLSLPGLSVAHVCVVRNFPLEIQRRELTRASQRGWSRNEFHRRANLPASRRRRSNAMGRLPTSVSVVRKMRNLANADELWVGIDGIRDPDLVTEILDAMQAVEARLIDISERLLRNTQEEAA